jgi:hypothetical protein
MHGEGTLKTTRGDTFVGVWKDNKMEGAFSTLARPICSPCRFVSSLVLCRLTNVACVVFHVIAAVNYATGATYEGTMLVNAQRSPCLSLIFICLQIINQHRATCRTELAK